VKHIDKIKEYSSYKEPYAGGDELYEEQIKASIPFLKLINPKKKRVLVVGCADGYEMRWLSDNSFTTKGITKSKKEVVEVQKKHNLEAICADMHDLPFEDNSFDCIYASNVLEHSVAPYVALREWRRVLKKNGWLVLVVPSKEWLPEYYHFSVLSHLQIKDLLYKSGYELLAGPQHSPKIKYNGGDIFYDLGRGRGHFDAFVSKKVLLPKNDFMVGKAWKSIEIKESRSMLKKIIKVFLKKPYNLLRVWWARNHIEIW
jgi:SAM-dependent methyltransferase